MQVVILAGGLGTRLKDHGLRTPKSMVPVGGRPFISYLLEQCRLAGVSNVLVLTGHLAEPLEEYLQTQAIVNGRVTCVRDDPPRGTGAALKGAASQLAETFVLMNGDTLVDVDLRDVYEKMNDETDLLLVVSPAGRGPLVEVANVMYTADGRVAAYQKGAGSHPYTHIEAGISVLRRHAVETLGDHAASLELDLYPALAATGRCRGYETLASVFDIGTPERIHALERALRSWS